MEPDKLQMFNDFMVEFDNVKELLKIIAKEQKEANDLLRDILREVEK